MTTNIETLKAQRADFMLARALEWLRLMGPCDMARAYVEALTLFAPKD